MKIRDKIVDRFFGRAIEARVKEGLKAASFLEAPTVDDAKWRRLTGNAHRELIPTAQDRMIEIAYWLWETNPLAGWLIDITTAFILAEELPYQTKDDQIKEVLDGFWNDPVNKMDLFLPKHVGELHVFGELCMPAFTAQQTGRVRLGYVDPAQIAVVVTDPENVKLQIGVLTKGWLGEIAGYAVEQKEKKYQTILPDEADYVMSATAKQLRSQFTDGECFYFGINNVTNSPRGRSSLLPVADWLDAYEQYVYDFADRWPMLNTFVWDMLVEGGTPETIKEQVQNLQKKSGSVFGHNEKVTLKAEAPSLQSAEAQEGARLLRNHIMGRFGYPEHWYGGGGQVNRATASEMDLPALKMITQKQNYVKYVLETMLRYQVKQARRANYLTQAKSGVEDFTVVTPLALAKDVSKFGSVVQQVATALVSAEMQGWVDKDTARKLFATVMAFIGVDIDIEEVKAKIEADQVATVNQDYLKADKKVQGSRVQRFKVAEKN